jgi:hypothetical protein
MTDSGPKSFRGRPRYVFALILLAVFIGVATFGVLSDNSIHGLTIKFYNVSWSCTSSSANPRLSFNFGSVVVYSSSSLTTSLSHVILSMSANGIDIGNVTAPDTSFSPGHSASYGPSFVDSTLDPRSQPLSWQIGLSINAQISAGLLNSQASASYSQQVQFTGQAC